MTCRDSDERRALSRECVTLFDSACALETVLPAPQIKKLEFVRNRAGVFRLLQIDSPHPASLFLEKRHEMVPDETTGPVTSPRSPERLEVDMNSSPSGQSRFSTLRGAVAAQHGRNRLCQNPKIEAERPIIDVLQIELHPALETKIAAALHLP
jgi:hypothetical protein